MTTGAVVSVEVVVCANATVEETPQASANVAANKFSFDRVWLGILFLAYWSVSPSQKFKDSRNFSYLNVRWSLFTTNYD
ncbi:MAG: hypothetical protein ACREEJ_11130 [Ensifer adhaerens]